MRHLLNPLDFSVEEIDDLLALQGTLNRIFQDTPMYATARSWPPFSMSQVHGRV